MEYKLEELTKRVDKQIVITWYYVFASFLVAFVVYLVATGGWEKIKEIWDRTKYKDSEGK